MKRSEIFVVAAIILLIIGAVLLWQRHEDYKELLAWQRTSLMNSRNGIQCFFESSPDSISEINSYFGGNNWATYGPDIQRTDVWGTPLHCLLVADENGIDQIELYSCGPDKISLSDGNDRDDLNTWTPRS